MLLCKAIIGYSAILSIVHIVGGQNICKFGRRCLYPCHCANNDICDSETGECPNGCDESNKIFPWGGLGCQIGNLSPQKFIEPYDMSNYGNADTWRMDLGSYYAVEKVIIANPLTSLEAGYTNVLKSTSIRIYNKINTAVFQQVLMLPTIADGYDYKLCNYIDEITDSNSEYITFNCQNGPHLGRFVYLHIETRHPKFMPFLKSKTDIVSVIGFLVPLNVALGKPVYTSDPLSNNNLNNRLVDGLTDPHYDSRRLNCFPVPRSTVIMIDLGKSYDVKDVHLTNPFYPTTCYTGNTKLRIQNISSTDLTQQSIGCQFTPRNNRNKHVTVDCPSSFNGRYLRINNDHDYGRAVRGRFFCEFIVVVNIDEVIPDGRYGEGALRISNCKDGANKVTGKCLSQNCKAGFQGQNCQKECDEWNYGENCAFNCTCSNGIGCNNRNGFCNECPEYRVGVTCSLELPFMSHEIHINDISENKAMLSFIQFDGGDIMNGEGFVTKYLIAIKDLTNSKTLPPLSVDSDDSVQLLRHPIEGLLAGTKYEVIITPIAKVDGIDYKGRPSDGSVFTTATNTTKKGKDLTGLIVGLVLGLLLVCLVAFLVIFCCCNRFRSKREQTTEKIKDLKRRSMAHFGYPLNSNSPDNFNINVLDFPSKPASLNTSPKTANSYCQNPVNGPTPKKQFVGPPETKPENRQKTEKRCMEQAGHKKVPPPLPTEEETKKVVKYDPNLFSEEGEQEIYENSVKSDIYSNY